MIYQIRDAMMSMRKGAFLNISLELQLIKSSNLVN